jgi:hypothetical protein
MADIMELSDEKYFKIPALSKSQIKNWDPYNPMAFWLQSAFNPNKAAEEFGDYLVTGKLYHMMLFQRDLVKDNFETNDELGKSRINKKWQAAQAASTKLFVSSEELNQAEKMMTAISRHEILRKLLVGGVIEKPFTWQEEAWGIPAKARLDLFKNTTEGIYVVDYKTTSKDMRLNFNYIDRGGFQFDIGTYNKAIKAKYGQPIKKFVFVLQSTNENEENMIRLLIVEGPQIEACEIATDLAVKQIVPRIKAWQAASAVICAEVDPAKHAEEVAKREDAMLRCWLPEIEAESWEVSPWFDKAIAENVHKGE